MDWTPKKSFLRDLSEIRNGMTGVQIENIMRFQQKNFAQPESEHFLHLNPTYKGEAVFRDNSNEDIGVIEFQDGHVVNVKYISE